MKAYAREHMRKPPDVSRRLNADGHRTASGAMWTPRLVRFLLALMFNDFGSRKRTGMPNVSAPGPATVKTATPKVPTISMDDKDEIANRLSALGRVTMRTKPQK